MLFTRCSHGHSHDLKLQGSSWGERGLELTAWGLLADSKRRERGKKVKKIRKEAFFSVMGS